MQHSSIPCGRLAPSPTGYIHLGNAWAFLLAWLAARSQGGQVLLRLEDIDPQRSRPDYAAAILEDLRWLGLDWDYGPDTGGPGGPYVQSLRSEIYDTALTQLEQSGLTYPCFCTRKELRQLAAAPHVDDTGAPYPGTCRHLNEEQVQAMLQSGRKACVRLRCPQTPIRFDDAVMGPQSFLLSRCGGDFALRRSDGVVAYQLAVAVDDALMGVTQVVRGRDLLSSTPRQMYLYRLFGASPPQYIHVPLLLARDGRRLSKREHDLDLGALRARGFSGEEIVGRVAYLAGLLPHPRPARPRDLLPLFSWEKVPKENLVLPEDLFRDAQ